MRRPGPVRAAAPDRELRHRAIASLAFGLLSMIALLGLGTDLRRGVYVLVFSTAVGLGACVVGFMALFKARRTGTYRPFGAVGGIMLGGLATLLSVPLLVLYLSFPSQMDGYFTCLGQAQSTQDARACLDQFTRSARPGAIADSDRLHGRSDGPRGLRGGSAPS